jgi:peptidoglycan hydrolase-like protein with peptidoglycan-binding domain
MSVVIESASRVGIPSSIGSYGKPSYGVTVHYIGSSHVSRGSHANCRRQVRGWHSYHKNGNGWSGIGYNFLICHHGIVLTGRGLYRIGAHNAVANSSYQGVCFMIGGNQQPTAKQLKGFRDLMKWMNARGVRTHNIKGHRDHISTSCPGNVLYGRVRANNWGSGGNVVPIGGGGGGTGGGMTSVRSIKSQQRTVNQEGYTPKLVVDGIYGPKTEAGVKWYQRKLGVAADGLWGPKTEAAHKRNEGGGSSGGGSSSSIGAPDGTPYLNRNDSGSRVRQLQRALIKVGEDLPKYGADGKFGAETEAALRSFQRGAGLSVDGVYGPKTEDALSDALSGKSSGGGSSVSVPSGKPYLRDGSQGARVRKLQKALRAAGHKLPRYGVDGKFGAETEAALRSFQRDAGIGVDGIYGPNTAKALRKAVK